MMHTNPDQKPSRDGLEPHQLWVWMAGATPPRWEVRGTGLVLPNDVPTRTRVCVDVSIVNDPELSWSAIGLHTWMKANPNLDVADHATPEQITELRDAGLIP